MDDKSVQYLSVTEAAKAVNIRQEQVVDLFSQTGLPNDTISMIALTSIGVGNLLQSHNWTREHLHWLIDNIIEQCQSGKIREINLHPN